MRPAAFAVMLALVVVAPAADAAGGKLSGPKHVTPGHKVTFHATGLPSGHSFYVRVQPSSTPKNRPGLDGGVIRRESFRSDDSGRVTVKFRFPKRRIQCGASCGGRAPWKKGGRVDVDLLEGRDKLLAHTVARIARG